jgi:hypothetical protein
LAVAKYRISETMRDFETREIREAATQLLVGFAEIHFDEWKVQLTPPERLEQGLFGSVRLWRDGIEKNALDVYVSGMVATFFLRIFAAVIKGLLGRLRKGAAKNFSALGFA